MKKFTKIMICIILTLVALLISAYIIAFLSSKPSIGKSSYLEMYDNKGEIFYQANHENSGSYVSLEEISPLFIDSIIAIEDRNFYQHHGFDLTGIIRAITNNVTSDTTQGASTITQQYARNLFLTNEVTYKRKIEEAIYAMQIETHYSKDQILEGYVNTIYFGHGVYGIENAAKFYFNKSASELNLLESAMLAGVINGPNIYSPLISPQDAKDRQQVVLAALLKQGKIDQATYDQSIQQETPLNTDNNPFMDTTLYYYKDTVINELKELGFYEKDYINQGLKIYTTMDAAAQNEMSSSVNNRMTNEQLQCSAIAIEPYTFKILALTGGKDYQDSQFNRATDASRQVASTIKPLLYYIALKQGFDPTTSFISEPTKFKLASGKEYAPTNFGNLYAFDKITLACAVGLSDNIYAMKTHLFLGEDVLTNQLKQFGYTHISPDASLALGTFTGSVYDIAQIYAAFASGGLYDKPYSIERIEDQQGNVLYQHSSKPTQLLDKTTCLVLSQLLTAPFDDKCILYSNPTLLNYKRAQVFAGKSGTSDYDSLVVGYNQKVVCATWVGFDDNTNLDNYDDRVVAKDIWYDLTNLYVTDSWYKPNDDIEERIIDPITGKSTPNGSLYWFKRESSTKIVNAAPNQEQPLDQ